MLGLSWFRQIFGLFLLLLPVLSAAENSTPATTSSESPFVGDEANEIVQVPEEDLADFFMLGPAKMSRSVRIKYDPTYRWLGIGKRDVSEGPRRKFGQNYKWIGLGKREAPRKFSPNYNWVGLGKRDPPAKFSQGYKWIGLGKRMAPYWSSQMMASLKELIDEDETKSRISRTSNAGSGVMRPWSPFYSVVTKKYTPGAIGDEDVRFGFGAGAESDGSAEKPTIVTPGRPAVRGGSFEPIYRYVGIGRR